MDFVLLQRHQEDDRHVERVQNEERKHALVTEVLEGRCDFSLTSKANHS
jgi:hypothetical protein